MGYDSAGKLGSGRFSLDANARETFIFLFLAACLLPRVVQRRYNQNNLREAKTKPPARRDRDLVVRLRRLQDHEVREKSVAEAAVKEEEEENDDDEDVSRGRRDRGREYGPLEGRIGVAAIAKVERMTSLDGCRDGVGNGGGVARGQNW